MAIDTAFKTLIDDGAEKCEHPNGFGINGCAACGASPDNLDLPDMSDRMGMKVDGVTTEVYPCDSTDVHPRHLHQPGKFTEWFTCNGRIPMAEAVAKTLRGFHEAAQNPLGGQSTPAAQDDPTEGQAEAPVLHSLPCPECRQPHERSAVLTHMREEELLDQSVLDEYADKHGLDRLPPPNINVRVAGCSACQNRSGPGPCDAHSECPVCEGGPGDCRECGRTDADKLRPLTKGEMRLEFGLNAEDELTEWWLRRARGEAEAVIPKAVAYGSNSLLQLGRKMAQLQGREVGDDEAMELGCWVYIVGKVERWTDAVMRGERCSDDTIYDAGIYIKMTQRIRDMGSWPGV